MTNNLSRKLRMIAAGAMALWCTGAWAVPAKPGIIRIKQSDGTEIAVRLFGDEHSHFYTSADNHLLLRDAQGVFRYAEPDGKGGVRASAMKAADADKRPASHTAFLNSLDKEAMIKAWHKADAATPHKIKRRLKHRATGYPTIGEEKGLVILVEYSDLEFKTPDPKQKFGDLLMKEGYSENGATGSAYDYFVDNSSGQFKPQFDVYGPVKLDKTMAYYGQNNFYGDDMNAHEMIIDACKKLVGKVDFKQYDCDSDGKVDNVFVFYAGYGEASSGIANTVWPHQWKLEEATGKPVYIGGVKLDAYACTNEVNIDNSMVGIGTFVHEFSHVLGLPDLYATEYTSSFTPGPWSVLDEGPYNNGGHTPPAYSAFERYSVKWLEPREIGSPESITLKDITTNEALIVKTDRAEEFYLIENRQQTGWDTYLPHHGMLVWHIDYDPEVWKYNVVNNTPDHQHVDLIEADNIKTKGSRGGDPFPGKSGRTEFTDDTNPSMTAWNDTPLGKPITNVREADGIITFDMAGGQSAVVAPEAGSATDITENSFTANWSKTPAATSYLLSVYTKGADGEAIFLDGMEAKDVGDVQMHKVEGLEPSTEYFYTVAAAYGSSVSEASEEVSLTTKEQAAGIDTATAGSAGTVSIYDMSGATVAENVVLEEAREKLPAGVYIAKGKDTTAKIVVR